ncbi:hypothetical protein AURDEDRAFT_123377 [Auricularia subglabra TFB-10046 SS5]|nr:hypothetical protein AURDEDRAFT_123377 [Auricularia subglabra TFB-10046 SS5]
MRFSFVVSILVTVVSLSLGLTINNADVVNVLSTLRARTDEIVPQISAYAQANSQLATETCAGSFPGPERSRNSRKRDPDLSVAANIAAADLEDAGANGHSPIEIATLTAGIKFTDIANALDVASNALSGHPSVAALAQGDLAAALGMVLSGVETVLSGVVDLVGSLPAVWERGRMYGRLFTHKFLVQAGAYSIVQRAKIPVLNWAGGRRGDKVPISQASNEHQAEVNMSRMATMHTSHGPVLTNMGYWTSGRRDKRLQVLGAASQRWTAWDLKIII